MFEQFFFFADLNLSASATLSSSSSSSTRGDKTTSFKSKTNKTSTSTNSNENRSTMYEYVPIVNIYKIDFSKSKSITINSLVSKLSPPLAILWASSLFELSPHRIAPVLHYRPLIAEAAHAALGEVVAPQLGHAPRDGLEWRWRWRRDQNKCS